MNKGLIGKKLGMTQIFVEDGRRIPVTVVEAGPCVVVQKKTVANDGYDAIQVGFQQKDAAKATRPLVGHCKAAGQGVYQYLRELRMDDVDKYSVGDQLTADVFRSRRYH
jgi:large subunit ribosomal protein L3